MTLKAKFFLSNKLQHFLFGLFLLPLLFYPQNDVEDIQSFNVGKGLIYSYKKPRFFEMVKYVPSDLVEFGEFTIKNENLLWTSLTVGSTIALIPFDQKLLDNAVVWGKPLGWDKDARYNRLLGILELFPKDINAAVYFLGNGVTTLIIGGTFYTFGRLNNDFRALNTANELVEVLISVGLTTQVMKRISGRQSPSAAIDTGNSGGHWTPFPSFKAYQSNTPHYDAFPSGHVATLMATITVIATNYPDVKWIKPVGYSLMSILAFEMMSARVHWISDYPLAILIGYVIGKNAANRRIIKEEKRDARGEIINSKFKFDFTFSSTPQFSTAGVIITF